MWQHFTNAVDDLGALKGLRQSPFAIRVLASNPHPKHDEGVVERAETSI